MNYEQKYLKYKQKYTALLPKQIGGTVEKIIIDTDPGIDDAIAILLALGDCKVQVLALTTVFGNFPDVTPLTNNALKILNLAGKTGQNEIPVYEGASSPLIIPPPAKNLKEYIEVTKGAQSVKVHGDNGLANLELEIGGLTKKSEFAANAIIRLAKENPGQVTLVALGPLTNLALALMMCPELPELLKSVIIMGGALFSPRDNPVNTSDANLGNAATAAEANFFKDPFSAQKVLNAGFLPEKIFLVPLDLTTQTDYGKFGLTTTAPKNATDAEIAVAKINTMPDGLKDGPITNFIAKSHHFYSDVYLNRFKRGKVPFHDACAVFMAISPKSFTTVPINVRVETKGEFTFGMTVIDHRPHMFPANITFCKTINSSDLKEALIASINKLQSS
jgi:inosine-uridine nucleoside N-ribohydrolase